MNRFDVTHRTRFIFGPGQIEQLGTVARQLGARRVFVVSDAGVVAAGHFQRGQASLVQQGLEVLGFHELHENPTTAEVDAGLAIARDYGPDLLVGLGGGSSMDCAKGINFLLAGGGEIKDYWGIGKAKGVLLPMIAVPTTAGTGSEAQSFALISDAHTHVKMACGDPQAACRIAILDPELTLTQPPRVTALTGIDALTHALETSVTRSRTYLSSAYAQSAFEHLAASFSAVITDPTDLEHRGRMQWGACLAGLAIETSMLGAAHALANPLTARYGLAHGQAVGVMMPHVVRFNARDPEIARIYGRLLASAGWGATEGGFESAGDRLASRWDGWLKEAKLSSRLSQLIDSSDALPELAESAAQQWTASHNPRALSTGDLLDLYRSAW